MRHDIRAAGGAFGLRPVERGDAEFIVALRSGSERSRFLHPIPPDVAAQESYLERYFERPDDYYFIVERLDSGQREGTVGLYDVDAARSRAEWGRWMLVPGSLAAVESAVLTYRVAFERLALDLVYCRTVAANTAVVSFHDSFGLERHAVLPGQLTLGGEVHDAVEHRLTRSAWEGIRAGVEAKAARIAARIGRGTAAPGGGPSAR